jgi:rhodanese-related sulfurtransferase
MSLFHRIPAITPDEAARRLAARELELVDVREPRELLDGHVAEVVHIPLGQLAARLGELDRDRPVAFICRSGARSAGAVRTAAAAGYDAVNVKGGMTAWVRAGLPTAVRRPA